jgi:hypothetical protein
MKTEYPLAALATFVGLFTTVNLAFAQDWMLTSAPNTNWSCVASSADGSKLVAGGGWPIGTGPIYTSSDSGTTWSLTSAPFYGWRYVASSADGTKLIALGSGMIYTSSNSGSTWTQTSGTNWFLVAGSADGTKLAAVTDGDALYTSTNSGEAWMPSPSQLGAKGVERIASSADGTKLVEVGYLFASGPPYGFIWTSTNAGATWTSANVPGLYGVALNSVASSADGGKLIAAAENTAWGYGGIWTSTNSGASWTGGQWPFAGLGFRAVGSSADGTTFFAYLASEGAILTSTNFGATWDFSLEGRLYFASSADGVKLVAADYSSIWTLQATPIPMLSLTPSGGNALISWTIPSLDFTLQQNSDLTTTNWTDVPTPPVLNLTNLQNQVIVSPPNGNTFYRLKH